MNKKTDSYYPQQPTTPKEFLLGVIILLICIGGFYILFHDSKDKSENRDYNYLAYCYSKDLVKDQLKSPSMTRPLSSRQWKKQK